MISKENAQSGPSPDGVLPKDDLSQKNGRCKRACFFLAAALVLACSCALFFYVRLQSVSKELVALQIRRDDLQSMNIVLSGQAGFLQTQVSGMKSALKQAGLVVIVACDPTHYHDPNCVWMDNALASPYRFVSLQSAIDMGLTPDPHCH